MTGITDYDREFLGGIKIVVPDDIEVTQSFCSARDTVDVIRAQEREIQSLKRKLIDMRKKINEIRRRGD